MGWTSWLVFWVCATGALTFSTLSVCFGRRYAFFKFHGDMEQAAESCLETAVLFGIGAVFAISPSISKAVREKRRQIRNFQKLVLPGGYRR